MKLVVYDLDHTLMPIDTGDWWAKWILTLCDDQMRREAIRTLDRFARQYIAQTLSIEEFESWQMGLLASLKRTDLECARADYKKEVLSQIIPERSRKIVRQAKDEGAITAICTATYSFATEPSAELFGVDYLLAVKPEQDEEGNFTGRWIEPITYQRGKVLAVKNLVESLARKGIEINDFEFWSDSPADMALFEFTEAKGGVCFVVNAREELRGVAQQRGWIVSQTYSEKEAACALEIVAKALAKRENASRPTKI